MSSAGVRRARSTDSRVADSILDQDRIQIENEKIFKETGDASTANSSGIANTVTAAGNFLAKSGDTWQGPYGGQFGIVEIIDDTIDVSLGSQNYFPVIVLNGEGGAADVLTRIVPGSGVFLNQEIIVQAGSFAITIQEIVAGNILTPGTVAFNLEPGDYAKLIFSIVAGNKWVVVWFSGNVGGGGGLTEPVIFGINTLTPQTLPTTTTIAWNTKNPQHIILDRAVEFDFTNLPANGFYEGILIIIDIDAVGGFASPIWPTSLVNPPVIPTTALSRFSVMLYTIDNGTVVTHATSVGSSSSGGITNLSDLIIDTNKDWLAQGISNIGDLTEVTGITGTGASVTISGIDTYDFFQAGQSIQNKADSDGGILYNVNDVQSHIFRADSVEIARFEENTPGILRLNMLEHSIKDAKHITFDVGASNSVPGPSPGIGYDTGDSRLIINVPASSHLAISENSIVGSTIIRDNELESDLVTVNASLLIGVLGGAPIGSGQFTNDGTDTFVFSGGAVRNFSDIGGGGSSPLTTKGDLFGFNTADARIPVGTLGQVLLADSAEALGVKWNDFSLSKITDADSNLDVIDGAGFTWVLDTFTIATMTTEFLLGLNLDMASNNILNPNKIIFSNGLEIIDTNTTTTTIAIPSTDTLIIQEGLSDIRMIIEKDIIFDCDTDNNIF